MPEKQEKVRVGQILIWTFVGLGVIVGATILADGWSDENYWSSVLINLGTTVLLAGFLVWLERNMVRQATVVATKAASEAATKTATIAAEQVANDAAANATKVFSAQIDALRDELHTARREASSAQDAAIGAMGSVISRQGLLDALSAAHHIGAIGSSIFVTGGPAIGDPVLRISLPEEATRDDDGRDLEIAVQADGGYWASVEWIDGDAPIDVFAELQTKMIKVGLGSRARAFDPEVFLETLRRALQEGTEGRRGDDGAWRTSGTLRDVIDSDWVISDRGVEHRDHGVVIPASHFQRAVAGPVHTRRVTPAKPAWTTDLVWSEVVERGYSRLDRETYW